MEYTYYSNLRKIYTEKRGKWHNVAEHVCGEFQPDLNSAVYMEWLLAYADLMKIVFQFCEKLVLNLTR